MKKAKGFIIISVILIIIFALPLIIYLMVPLIYESKLLHIPEDYDINIIYWTVALTYSTILLALVAAFQDHIKRQLWRPHLTFTLDITPPHSHLLKSAETYYIRMKIGNVGQISAQKVEVFLKEVRYDNGMNIGLSSDNLQWSSTNVEVINENMIVASP